MARRSKCNPLTLWRSRESFVGLICLAPTFAHAHSFGTPYILPVPFWMYVYGCAATLVVTFALFGFFVSERETSTDTRVREVRTGGLARIAGRWALWVLRIGAVGCLFLTILAGLIGVPDPADNIAMTLFWVIFLLGLTYVTLFVGDIYALVNPWKLAVEGLERIGLNLSSGRLHYPARLGYWPAFVCYVALIWIELFGGFTPFALSVALLVYSVMTFAGAALFGKAAWFAKAELFSVFFALVGKLAPVEYKQTPEGGAYRVSLRPPFSGALRDRADHLSIVLIVLFILSSTTYDAIHDTALWAGLFWKNALVLLQPLWGTDLGKAQDLLMGWYLAYRQAGLLVFPFLYLGLYVLVLSWARLLTRTPAPLARLALDFCYSLLPIAVAYHFTHYFTFLIVQAQSLPGLLSDPFGFGWNSSHVEHAPPQLKMGVIWHTQVAVLLAGHVVSVYLAHKTAVRAFTTRREAVLSQLPLLLLMVAYTVAGLWILSLPLAPE